MLRPSTRQARRSVPLPERGFTALSVPISDTATTYANGDTVACVNRGGRQRGGRQGGKGGAPGVQAAGGQGGAGGRGGQGAGGQGGRGQGGRGQRAEGTGQRAGQEAKAEIAAIELAASTVCPRGRPGSETAQAGGWQWPRRTRQAPSWKPHCL